LGFKNGWDKGYFYSALYHRISDGTITRIATTVEGSNLIYNISQNAGKSYNTGLEVVISQELSDKISMALNLNGYYNQIDAFTVLNRYPVENTFTAEQQEMYSGNFIFSDRCIEQRDAIFFYRDENGLLYFITCI
jgi:outer membrane receptor protein involved in Fe transport